MTEQQIFNFQLKQIYNKENFIKDISNSDAYEYFYKFPKWENNLINLYGEKKSGKTYLMQIFKKEKNFFYINNLNDFNSNLNQLYLENKVILDDLIIEDEKMFSLINNFILHKKFLVFVTEKPITLYNFQLKDLNSRLKEFYLIEIKNPSDHLVYSLIIKFFSDNQILIKKEIVENIVKKIDRSYSRIHEFLFELNKRSIMKKKKIDFKLINEIIETIF